MSVLLRLSLIISVLPGLALAANPGPVAWRDWSPAVFEQARQEHKLVLLDMEAVWCHWCHVMDQQTYANADVAAWLEQHYIAVKVDQDARPDLANRYRDYGWPATILFAADGTELVKRAGYIPPQPFLQLLTATVNDPTPEARAAHPTVSTFAGSPQLDKRLRDELKAMHQRSYDARLGGLRLQQKFLDRDSVEYMLVRARQGDQDEAARARQTLDAARALIDPVWGGVYQYSTGGDWQHPHFEKIMEVQAGYLRLYALAYAQWGRDADLQSARAIRDYLNAFLSAPDGAFYTSQDADVNPGEHSGEYFALDDKARRAEGIPRVDQHRYARENGWAIEALVSLYAASGDQAALTRAEKAARWTLQHRALDGGGFRHDQQDSAGPYLGDTLAMGRACLALHQATGERDWLDCARGAADFIGGHFKQDKAGFLTSAPSSNDAVPPVPHIDENIALTRFANLLFHYTDDARYQALAQHGMRYLATPDVATARIEEAGVLLADQELATPPRHFAVVARHDDDTAAALYTVALRQPGAYKRLEWWDRRQGPLPNADVPYPETDRPAAYVCTENRCSTPSFTAARYQQTIQRLTAPDPRTPDAGRRPPAAGR
ncbi:thioredoxin domain-containing protein [Alloalcanivorax mobilis]|uniref:thioredoxin domain-containing protein n=1 Tax=Alloalcanivorax mobilis TaxID=2019569 RepID=UPI0018E4840D|nr:DUF255 domain-containing protein [Alloalcanivorax mobilis]